jgi:hypothetical protein
MEKLYLDLFLYLNSLLTINFDIAFEIILARLFQNPDCWFLEANAMLPVHSLSLVHTSRLYSFIIRNFNGRVLVSSFPRFENFPKDLAQRFILLSFPDLNDN